MYSAFFRMTLTIALQNAIVYSVNLADNIMVGRYNQVTMSGIALVNQIQFFLQMLIMGAGDGIVVIASRFWGGRDTASIRKTASIGMYVGLFFASVLWGVVYFFPSQVLGLLTPEQAVIAEGVKYMRIVCFSYILFAVTNILLATLRSVESVRIGFYVSLAALISNVLLNYTLIYGHFGFPEMGGKGAALATVLSRCVELVVVLLYFILADKKIGMKLSDYGRMDRQAFGQYLKVSMPVVASGAAWGIAQFAQTAVLGHLGETAIAANSISSTVFSIVTVVIYGAASATAVVIGKALGEGKRDKMPEYSRSLQVIYIGLGLITGLLLFLIKDPIVSFYRINEETHQLALQFMTVLSVTVVGTAYQMTSLSGIVRGGGDTSFILYNDLIFIWLIVIPSAVLAAFVFHTPPVIVFICLKCDQILKCFVAVYWVNSYRWIKKI